MVEDLFLIQVKKGNTVAGRAFLMADPRLETGVCGIQVADVHCVAVTLTCGVVEGSVVVDNTGAGNDLLPAVAVNVNRHTVVVSAAISGSAGACARVEDPQLLQLFILHSPGGGGHSTVVASSGDNAWVNAVKIRNSSPEAIHAVELVGAFSPGGGGASAHFKIHSIKGSSCLSVEQGVILRTGDDESVGIAVNCVGTDALSGSVNSSVGSFAGHFALAVQVEVCNE